MCSQAAGRKAAGAAGRVVNGFLRLGIHNFHHRIDQRSRREVLPGTGFDLLPSR
jgi:hypothetical protein